jgi:NAD(P)-dependent dehydrogenase (short-subunit alcohol dehydrogenase family)
MSFLRPGLFAGRTAVVTGGATGIGFAISSELLALGCDVLIASRNKDRLEEAVGKLNDASAARGAAAGAATALSPAAGGEGGGLRLPQASMFPCDIRDEASVAALMATASER